MDRGAWRTTVQRVIKSWTGLGSWTATKYPYLSFPGCRKVSDLLKGQIYTWKAKDRSWKVKDRSLFCALGSLGEKQGQRKVCVLKWLKRSWACASGFVISMNVSVSVSLCLHASCCFSETWECQLEKATLCKFYLGSHQCFFFFFFFLGGRFN